MHSPAAEQLLNGKSQSFNPIPWSTGETTCSKTLLAPVISCSVPMPMHGPAFCSDGQKVCQVLSAVCSLTLPAQETQFARSSLPPLSTGLGRNRITVQSLVPLGEHRPQSINNFYCFGTVLLSLSKPPLYHSLFRTSHF